MSECVLLANAFGIVARSNASEPGGICYNVDVVYYVSPTDVRLRKLKL